MLKYSAEEEADRMCEIALYYHGNIVQPLAYI